MHYLKRVGCDIARKLSDLLSSNRHTIRKINGRQTTNHHSSDERDRDRRNVACVKLFYGTAAENRVRNTILKFI